MTTTYGSVCSGIEAASVAWHSLGWTPAWFSEIEPFPSAVLAHHWPQVPNLGDFTKIRDKIAAGETPAPDVLVGGTPCQAFSVAGLRNSLEDHRGQLSLEFVRLVDAIDDRRTTPCTIVWENVPGVLSTKDNAFGCFLGALAGEDEALVPPGGRWANAGRVLGPKRTVAWRILDAQYFGVAQRRRRVFVVASAGTICPEQVLFEFDGVRRDSPPCREAGKGFAHDVAPCLTSGGRGVERTGETRGQDPVVAVAQSFDARNGLAAHGSTELRDIANPLRATDYKDPQIACCATGDVFHTLRAEGHDASEDGTGRGAGAIAVAHVDIMPTMTSGGPKGSSHGQVSGQMRDAYMVPVASVCGGSNPIHTDGSSMFPLTTRHGDQTAVALALRGREGGATAELGDGAAFTLRASSGGGDKPHALVGMQVRRLTPTECERLQGFPDGHTRIPWRGKPAEDCPDGPRYKALGNSMAVPVMRWIGARIALQMELQA